MTKRRGFLGGLIGLVGAGALIKAAPAVANGSPGPEASDSDIDDSIQLDWDARVIYIVPVGTAIHGFSVLKLHRRIGNFLDKPENLVYETVSMRARDNLIQLVRGWTLAPGASQYLRSGTLEFWDSNESKFWPHKPEKTVYRKTGSLTFN